LLAIYMPIIQEALRYFTRIWNIHTIRKQPKRPNCVSGQPFKNYMYPGAIGYEEQGYPVPKHIIEELTETVEDIGITARLPNALHCQLAS
jgi:hypothetical protein